MNAVEESSIRPRDTELEITFPLQNVENVQEFEKLLANADVRSRFITYLAQIGGNSAEDCLLRMLRRVFGTAAVNHSSWCGQRGNYKVCDLEVICTIKEVVRRSFACTEKTFETDAKEWVRQGTQKYARLMKETETQ